MTYIVALSYVLYEIFRTLSIIVNSAILTSYSDIFSHIVAYVEPCVALAYAEPCHIQDFGTFIEPEIYSKLCQDILLYSPHCVMLAYWEPCHMQNFAIFRVLAYLGPEAYSESCLFRHIQPYSGIFNNDSYKNMSFLFLKLILHIFGWNLMRHLFFDYNDNHY